MDITQNFADEANIAQLSKMCFMMSIIYYFVAYEIYLNPQISETTQIAPRVISIRSWFSYILQFSFSYLFQTFGTFLHP